MGKSSLQQDTLVSNGKLASVWDKRAVEQAFASVNVKPVHAARLWIHLAHHPGSSWTDVPDLPKAAVRVLNAKFAKFTTKIVNFQKSSDGETTKMLVELQSGHQVESVVMLYDTSARFATSEPMADDAADTCSVSSSGPQQHAQGQQNGAKSRGQLRATLCVSSQVGCAMGCTFCATGTMGLKGNLTTGEIIEQLVHANAMGNRIRNVVFMGMGEPLANYEAVRDAVALMTDPRVFALARRQVTISTVGVIPRIRQLAEDLPGVALALSLHAPTQALRMTIVPTAETWTLDALMEAVQEYERASNMKVFVEYVLLAGINDGIEQAHELGKLLQGHNPRPLINLIPWNPVLSLENSNDGGLTAGGSVKYAAPSQDAINAFSGVLKDTYHLHCTVRQEKGQDISGACGQLVVETKKAAAALKQQASKAAAAAGPAGGHCDAKSCSCSDAQVPSTTSSSLQQQGAEETLEAKRRSLAWALKEAAAMAARREAAQAAELAARKRGGQPGVQDIEDL